MQDKYISRYEILVDLCRVRNKIIRNAVTYCGEMVVLWYLRGIIIA